MDSKTKGEQKHEFPYLATTVSTSFDAGAYEAQVTVRQGRQTITRVVPFRVLDSKLRCDGSHLPSSDKVFQCAQML